MVGFLRNRGKAHPAEYDLDSPRTEINGFIDLSELAVICWQE
jgi:hypothetical protein